MVVAFHLTLVQRDSNSSHSWKFFETNEELTLQTEKIWTQMDCDVCLNIP